MAHPYIDFLITWTPLLVFLVTSTIGIYICRKSKSCKTVSMGLILAFLGPALVLPALGISTSFRYGHQYYLQFDNSPINLVKLFKQADRIINISNKSVENESALYRAIDKYNLNDEKEHAEADMHLCLDVLKNDKKARTEVKNYITTVKNATMSENFKKACSNMR